MAAPKGQPYCKSVPVDSSSTTPYFGNIPSAGPRVSGGIQPMLAIGAPCNCPPTQCCGPGDSGADGPSGGPDNFPRFS
jgi:hypothetical protein